MKSRLLNIQFSLAAQSCPTLWDPVDCSKPGIPSISNSQSLLKLMSIESVIPSNHLILCPSPFSPTFKLSQHQSLFQWVGSSHQVAKVLQLRPQHISPSNEYSGLISFRMDWFDLLAVQGISTVFSNSTVRKYLFFDTQPSLWSTSHIHTWLLEKP